MSSSKTRILVDAGLSCRELMRRMVQAGEDPYALDAILITHEHADHVAGLSVLARRLNIPVYFTEATHRAWVRQVTPRTTVSYAKWLEQRKAEMALRDAEMEFAGKPVSLSELPDDAFFVSDASPEMPGGEPARAMLSQAAAQDAADAVCRDLCASGDAETVNNSDVASDAADVKANPGYLPAVEHFRAGSHLAIGDFDILPFTIPHDAADPCGFVFEAEGVRVGFATDLGYVPPNVKMALKNCDVLLIESNHDLEMLRDGPYPWSVKQRVLSRVGHLSNAAAAEFLTRDYDGGAKYVVLAHLSESNNLPHMAMTAAEQALGNRMRLLGNRIVLATQHEPTESLHL